MDRITIYCRVLAIRESQYSEIVVEDLNRDSIDDLKYIMVTKLPNWDSNSIEIGDIGYLEFQYVIGGETRYFNRNLEDHEFYKYSNNYFMRFIKKQELCKQDKFKFE